MNPSRPQALTLLAVLAVTPSWVPKQIGSQPWAGVRTGHKGGVAASIPSMKDACLHPVSTLHMVSQHILLSAAAQRLRGGNASRAGGVYSSVCPDLVKEFNKYDTDGPSGLNSVLESRRSKRKNFPLTLLITDLWDSESPLVQNLLRLTSHRLSNK